MDENAQIVKIKKLFYLQFLKSRQYVHAFKKICYAVDGNACNVRHRKKGMQ